MESLRTIADELMVSAKQVFDDRKISLMQMRYWVLIVANRMISQRIEAQGTESQRRSGKWMTTFVLPIKNDDHEEPNGNRICGKYVDLPRDIYDYENDDGVDYMIAYLGEECDGCQPHFEVQFRRTTPRLAGVSNTEYERPRPRAPKFYRENDRLWLLGLEQVDTTIISKVQVGLLCTLPNIKEVDVDAPLNFPAERIDVLRKYVFDMIRSDISLPNTKLRNDGTEGPQVAPVKGISVNDPNLNTV